MYDTLHVALGAYNNVFPLRTKTGAAGASVALHPDFRLIISQEQPYGTVSIFRAIERRALGAACRKECGEYGS
jgi:hypothetical protein